MSIPKAQTYHYKRHEPEKTTLYKGNACRNLLRRRKAGKSKGKKAIVLKSATDNDYTVTKGLVAKSCGFSLNAGVHTRAHERDKLEKNCRYIARPAVSEERLSTDDYGNVIY